MPTERLAITGYHFQQADKLFCDACVWLGVYGPATFQTDEYRPYAAAMKQIREVGALVVVEPVVLGEFINRWLSDAFHRSGIYEEWDDSNPKDFRNSREGQGVLEEAVTAVRNTLGWARRWPDCLSDEELLAVLGRAQSGELDVNDAIYEQICLREGFALLTHDGDFRSTPVRVITANRALLR